ncbi:MAG: ribbon-helix-helix domain-containing protein [archaeon]
MEIVCIRMEESLVGRMNKSMKENGYSTTTEFIREAVRSKVEQDEREWLAKEFSRRFYGKAKVKTTYAEERRIREQAYKELVKERGWDTK